MKDDVMNIELRKEILTCALIAEDGVRRLLLFVLNISKEDRKAISKKSSVLSFNDKINILFDLEIINNDEYKNFLLLSEFRNKFMHDIDCFSFKEAVDIFDKFNNQSSKGKELLKFHPDKSKHKKDGTEDDYKRAYFKLAQNLHDVIGKKINDYIEEKTENYNFVSRLLEYHVKTIYFVRDIVGTIKNNRIIYEEIDKELMVESDKLLQSNDLSYLTSMLDKGIMNRFVFKLPPDICGKIYEEIALKNRAGQ